MPPPPAAEAGPSAAGQTEPQETSPDGRAQAGRAALSDRLFGPVRHRLMFLLAIVLLPSILLGVHQATLVYDDYAARLRQTVREFAILSSSLNRSLLAQAEQIMSAVAASPSVQRVSKGDAGQIDNCASLLASSIQPFTLYGYLALFDLEGSPRCLSSDQATPWPNIAQQSWFRETIESRKSGTSGYVMLTSPQEPGFVVTRPVIDDDGTVTGLLTLGVRLKFLAAVTDEAGLPPGSVVYLLDRNGRVLSSFDESGSNSDTAAPSENFLTAVAGRNIREFEAPGEDGVVRLYATAALPYYDLHVLFGLPKAQVLDPVWWKVAAQVLVLAASWFIAILCAWIGTRWVVTRWVDRLTVAAHAMTAGNLRARADLDGAPDEIATLGATLVSFAERIDSREAELRTAIAQQKTMLREVHHRVKNNLQTVTSLLNLHAKGPRAEGARQVFADVQMRINALALVHRHLYESEDMRAVALRPFLGNLCKLIQDGAGIRPTHVRLKVDVADINLPGDTAVPIALLVTELLTNSFKHGFPADRSGVIEVTLRLEDRDRALLVIADDGVGMEQRYREGGSEGGIGFSLIRAFVKQLDGEIDFSEPPGSRTTIRFPITRYREAPPEDSTGLVEFPAN